MSIIQGAAHTSAGGYNIERSLRFNSADTPYLNRTPGSAGNRQKFTISVWYKPCGISTSAVNANIINAGGDGSSLLISGTGAFGGTYDNRMLFREAGSTLFYWPMVFRDPSAWYHIVFAMDTTQATAANRAKLYVNGVDQGAFSGTAITQNTSTSINNTSAHAIGTFNSAYPNNLYYTEYYLIDGQQLAASSFGETDASTGVWKPKKYTGTYGTNGFFLKFADNSGTTATTLGKDSSGNGNNWTPNNFSVTAGAGNDSLVDTPTPYGSDTGAGGEVRGNYCVLNPIDPGSVAAPTNGNLDQTLSGTNGTGASGSMVLTTGKWYWEVSATATTNAAEYVGVIRGALPSTAGPTTNPSGFYYGASGNNREDGTTVTYGNSYSTLGTTYVIGVALDCDANTAVFYLNGVSQGTRTLPSTTSGWKPQTGFNSSTGSATMIHNFGQRPFAYTAPSGFKALCTQNLPTPTIGATSTTQANDYFNAVLYTGNGSTQTITGVGFQPDLVWNKSRSNAYSNWLEDSVRGATKIISSNSTDAEVTDASYLTAFTSDGFSLGNGTGVNANGATYVAWNWNAGGSNATNTSGTITSTVRANTTAGFSIVTWTGTSANATVGHGLGVAPKLVIVKNRDEVYDWPVWHTSLAGTEYLYLNSTIAKSTAASLWNSTVPTSTVFSIGTSGAVNNSTKKYVAYCFAEVAGYSKFGSYTGNGSTDGPFVYLGFRPRYVMIKRTDSTQSWLIQDSVRDGYNCNSAWLYPNLSNAEDSGTRIDLLSNGFKFRNATAGGNESGGTFIYAAFAETPAKYSLAR